MRVLVLLAGILLLLLGLGGTVAGGVMKDFGDTCIEIRCDDTDLVAMGAWGQGIFGGGFLLGLAGIALLVAAVVAPPRERKSD